jgi:hypothetical protein
MLCKLISSASGAELDPFDDVDRVGAHEVWTGIDAAGSRWLAYTGATVAPWGDTHTDGVRLRTTAGHGRYALDSLRGRAEVVKSVADLSIGYQMQLDDLTGKLFLGWAVLDEVGRTRDGTGQAHSRIQGVKLAAELWLDWSETTYASLDMAYADTRDLVDVRARVGQRLEEQLSVGPEAGFNRSTPVSGLAAPWAEGFLGDGRIGAFVRYEWFGGEISAAGGAAFDVSVRRDHLAPQEPDTVRPYGAVNLLLQF